MDIAITWDGVRADGAVLGTAEAEGLADSAVVALPREGRFLLQAAVTPAFEDGQRWTMNGELMEGTLRRRKVTRAWPWDAVEAEHGQIFIAEGDIDWPEYAALDDDLPIIEPPAPEPEEVEGLAAADEFEDAGDVFDEENGEVDENPAEEDELVQEVAGIIIAPAEEPATVEEEAPADEPEPEAAPVAEEAPAKPKPKRAPRKPRKKQ